MLRRAALALTVLLAACGDGDLEECRALATAERDTVDRLIAESEANLLRGYALEPVEGTDGRFRLCAGGDGPLSLCAERGGKGETRPVAINPITERLKLANLRQRREALNELAERELAQCEVLHGRRR
ncbi:MAG: hypothetical protein N2Z62_08880 [Rhodobacteraceae bacterium]|nr:hypothetical protein [Paracoccaceae bacterium]